MTDFENRSDGGPGDSASPARQTPVCPLGISHAILGEFLQMLEIRAFAKGGQLTMDDIRAFTKTYLAFQRDDDISPEACMKLRAGALWNDDRRAPFERMLTQRFIHLMPKTADSGANSRFPRTILPGFITAVTKMIGPESFDRCQARAQDIVERYREAGLGVVDWPTIFEDPETKALIDEVLAVMAGHFMQLDKRLQWLTDLLNAQAARVAGSAVRQPQRLDEATTLQLIDALYADLRRRHAQDPHLSQSSRETLDAFFKVLESHHQAAAG